MGNKTIQEEIQGKQQGIINLTSRLTSTNSDIGDYKVVKTYEARLKGEADPYDTDALLAARQAVRDEINRLQGEVEALQGTADV